MRKIKKVYIFLLLILPAYIFPYSIDELLDEGRQAMNVINEYNRLKSIDVKKIYFHTFFKTFHPYEVDTSIGKDPARLFFGGMDFIINTTEHGRIISVGQFFWLGSADRKKVVDGESMLLNYGYAFDMYIGYDQVLFKYFLINAGAIFSVSKLNDVVQSGSLPQGGDAYKEIEQDSTFNVDPVMGIQLFGFPLISMGSTVSYSFKKKRVTSSSTILKMELSRLIKNIGDVSAGYKTYSFLDNNNAFVFRWDKIYDMVAFGLEIFTGSNKVGEAYIEFNIDIFRLIRDFKEYGKDKKKSKTGQASSQSVNTPEGEIRNTVKGQLRTMLRQPINRDTSLFLFLRFNLARTPETEELLNSTNLLFGWKMGLKFTFLRTITAEAYWLYNYYPELLMFKHSADRHGIIIRLTAFY